MNPGPCKRRPRPPALGQLPDIDNDSNARGHLDAGLAIHLDHLDHLDDRATWTRARMSRCTWTTIDIDELTLVAEGQRDNERDNA